MIQAYPKIFALGSTETQFILDDPVEVTEKIDGSQIAFGVIDNCLYIRSKNMMLDINNPNKLFSEGVEYIKSIQDQLNDGYVFFAEYLKRPKHNALSYNRIPHNHMVLFGVRRIDGVYICREKLQHIADGLNIESVPVIYSGCVQSPQEIINLTDRESFLGGCKIEGVVIKNYPMNSRYISTAKYVRDEFKERLHKKDKTLKAENSIKEYFNSYKTEARWRKAVQHLRENGDLSLTPQDIGPLLREIHTDIIEEDAVTVKEWLWLHYQKQLKHAVCEGFSDWYKKQLTEGAYE